MRILGSLVILTFCLLLAGSALAQTSKKYTLRHQDRDRTYTLVAPPTPLETKTARRPAIIMLHGGGGTGMHFRHLAKNGFEDLSAAEGVVIAYPDGYKRQWNDGRDVESIPAHVEGVDDVGFISKLIDDLIRNHHVDPRRVYVGGISNGGMMSHRLACELSGKIAAIAPVAASMPKNLAERCNPGSPVSVLMINGTRDKLVPYGGGRVTVGVDPEKSVRGEVISVPAAARFWAMRNGFNPKGRPSVSYLPDADTEDLLRIQKTEYRAPRGDVRLYTVEGGGHTWPGGLQYAPDYMVGHTTQELDTVKVMWDFFRKHPKATR